LCAEAWKESVLTDSEHVNEQAAAESEENTETSEQTQETSTHAQEKAKPQAKTFTQREFTAELKRHMAAAEGQIREKIMADIELDNAKASGELSKVVDTQARRIQELEPLQAELNDFRDLAEKRYTTAFDALPDSIRLFAPTDEASILEKERWLLEKALPAAEQMASADPVKGLSKANDPKPKEKTKDDVLKDIRASYSLTGEYRPM
jgi:hypothetical protein